jgi:hypothetical protein
VIAGYKHSILFGLIISNEGKKFYNFDTRKSKFGQLVIHDDGLVVDVVVAVQPRLVPGRPDPAENQGEVLAAVAETGDEDEEQVDARISVLPPML